MVKFYWLLTGLLQMVKLPTHLAHTKLRQKDNEYAYCHRNTSIKQQNIM